MTGMLMELAVAAGLAAAVLGTAAVTGSRDVQQTGQLLQAHVAREGVAGLLAQVAEAPPAPGRHAVALDALPVVAALPDARAASVVTAPAAGLRRIEVTLHWTAVRGPQAITVATMVRVRD